jgi:hypothetical protein
MKIRLFFTLLILPVLVIVSFFLSACVPEIKTVSIPDLFWNENEAGTVETNDITRLQKIMPFTIVVPSYLPDDLKTLLPRFVMHRDISSGGIDFYIDYYSSVNPRQITISENIASIELPKGVLSQMHPDHTALDIDGIEVIERSGIAYVIRSANKVQVNEFSYVWNRNKVSYSCSVDGYDKTESRKIIKSMIK